MSKPRVCFKKRSRKESLFFVLFYCLAVTHTSTIFGSSFLTKLIDLGSNTHPVAFSASGQYIVGSGPANAPSVWNLNSFIGGVPTRTSLTVTAGNYVADNTSNATGMGINGTVCGTLTDVIGGTAVSAVY